MKKDAFQRLSILFRRLGISLFLITFTRLLLYLFNREYFDLGFEEFISVFWHGLRFDLSTLAAFQAPFVLFYFIPVSGAREKVKQSVTTFLFHLANFLIIAFNSLDSIYFRFIQKRSTADLFSFITTGDDTLRLIPQFAADYWYVFLLALVLCWLGFRADQRIPKPVSPPRLSAPWFLFNFGSLILMAGLTILAIRGGFQLKPLRTLNAVEVAGMKNAPLVLNTPFTLMKTFNKETIRHKSYFGEEALHDIYVPVLKGAVKAEGMNRKNVVIIIMESFSKEYMGPPFGLEGKTPFLDSLAKESLFFNRAFANGKKSIEGIPAILAGIPSLMEGPYITSVYAGNKIEPPGLNLKEEGYQTAFFHGGQKGTMGFDGFASLAGFDHYYSMEEFSGPESFDGNWGIYDEPFFSFFGEKLNEMKTPFFASFFSLSSHHPYKIPEQYAHIYTGSKHPLLNTVAYSDMALKKFFDQVKEMPWYPNTLFVITADHTGQSFNPSYATPLGNFAVPLLFFSPGDSALRGVSERVTQHINIGPGIMDYLQYNKPFFSFGNSSFEDHDKEDGFAINYLNNIFQFISGDHLLQFDGEKTIGFYNYSTDSLLQHSLLQDSSFSGQILEMENKCKAVIQTYHSALIENRQTSGFYQEGNQAPL